METLIRKRKIYLLILAACCFVGTVRIDNKRFINEPYCNDNSWKEKRIIQREKRREDTRKDAVFTLMKSTQRWMDVRELTGNNDHPMITVAMNLCGLNGNKGYAWCAACQTEIHEYAGLVNPRSARVVDWFQQNVIWEIRFGELPPYDKRGMVGGLYYQHLGRLGHIVLIAGEDNNNYYTLEGNTNLAGSREGDGFYRKIRNKESISALADYCLIGRLFIEKYDSYLQSKL
jgi:hypothetical protein